MSPAMEEITTTQGTTTTPTEDMIQWQNSPLYHSAYTDPIPKASPHLTAPTRTALILLNAPMGKSPSPLLEWLWTHSALRICADGGANRLYQTCPSWIPHHVVGDLDSLHESVRTYYEQRGCSILHRPDQNYNDLDKALQVVFQEPLDAASSSVSVSEATVPSQPPEIGTTEDVSPTAGEAPPSPPFIVTSTATTAFTTTSTGTTPIRYDTAIVYGAFGGRFDQEMASFQALFKWKQYRIWLYDDHTCATLLPAGIRQGIRVAIPPRNLSRSSPNADEASHNDHNSNPSPRHGTTNGHGVLGEGPTCGLIPLGEPCRSVQTTGLQWNLNHQSLQFGDLVSTSNRIIGEEGTVTILSSHPIIFTLEVYCGRPNQWSINEV